MGYGEHVARRTQQQPPKSANLSAEEMRAALPRLTTRLEELRAIRVEEIATRGEPGLVALQQKVNSTLSDILGSDTVEHRQFGEVYFDRAGVNLYHSTPMSEVRAGYARGIGQTVSSIEALISLFEEKLGAEGQDTTVRAKRAFKGLTLHPELEKAVTRLFDDGHYANAVEDACKVLDGIVKIRAGRSDLGGTELMQAAFSAKNPVLRFNGLQDESDRSEQQGMMFLYAGAMLALRNPRAHSIREDEAVTALEYIAFVNFLLRALDRTTKS